jgi:hypothetical protein
LCEEKIEQKIWLMLKCLKKKKTRRECNKVQHSVFSQDAPENIKILTGSHQYFAVKYRFTIPRFPVVQREVPPTVRR